MVGRERDSEIIKENDTKKDTINLKSSGDYYNDILLPQALIYGMTPKEFWDEDPALMWSYHIAYINKVEIDKHNANFNAWLLGSYICSAINATVGNMLGGKGITYISEPVNLSEYKDIDKSKHNLEEQKIKSELMRIKNLLNKNKKE